jgi:hypothetical protein
MENTAPTTPAVNPTPTKRNTVEITVHFRVGNVMAEHAGTLSAATSGKKRM